MSEREIRRIEVLSEVMSGRRTLVAAAALLAVTPRHARRLLLRLQAGGGTALAHKARGRPSNNKIDDAHNHERHHLRTHRVSHQPSRSNVATAPRPTRSAFSGGVSSSRARNDSHIEPVFFP
jgi:Winged helix-turn helix